MRFRPCPFFGGFWFRRGYHENSDPPDYRGLFDRYPNLRMILGHVGEYFPYSIDRMNNRFGIFNGVDPELKWKHDFTFYFKNKNIFMSTSGIYDPNVVDIAIKNIGIADTYEQSKYNWMKKYKISGAFDPNADYDGDGQTNYAEYLAGTDPFDATDRFGVDTMENESKYEVEGEGYIKVTFETNAGRTYKVVGADDLGSPSWNNEKFKTDPDSEATVERVSNSRSQYEVKTIYLLKQGAKRFYKLELEQ